MKILSQRKINIWVYAKFFSNKKITIFYLLEGKSIEIKGENLIEFLKQI